jgi:hypothetical protein
MPKRDLTITQYEKCFFFILKSEINSGYFNATQDRLMKPLAGYIGYNSEWRELAQVISRVIFNLILLNNLKIMT